jgi:hypothetical protein
MICHAAWAALVTTQVQVLGASPESGLGPLALACCEQMSTRNS